MSSEDRGTQIKVGIFILIGLVTVALMLVYFGRMGEGLSNYYNLRIEFANASGLLRGSEVLLAGAKVGRVINPPTIMPDMRGVYVEARILESVKIPVGSEFSIGSSGLLGDKYIQIVLKSDSKDSEIIAPDSTIKGSDMGDGIASMASGAGELIGDLKTTVGNINKIVTKLDSTVLAKSELDSITATIRNLETTTGKLAASSSKIESLVTQAESTIKNGNETMTSAKKAADELQQTLASFRQLAEQARKGSGVLGSLISNREMADNLRVFILNLRKHGILWYKDTQKVKSGDAE